VSKLTVESLIARIEALEARVKELENPRRHKRNPKRCRFVTEGDVRFWMPECMGGGVYGDKDHCHCPE